VVSGWSRSPASSPGRRLSECLVTTVAGILIRSPLRNRSIGEEPSTGDDPTQSAAERRDDPPISPAILGLDHVYESLAHSRRRYLCYTLLEDTEWSFDELARKVAAWEYEVPDHDVTSRQQEEVYVSLDHAHVPKLVEDGIISFDDGAEATTTAEIAEQVLAVLEGIGASLDSTQEDHARSEMDESKE
jgi:hypothetical protein